MGAMMIYSLIALLALVIAADLDALTARLKKTERKLRNMSTIVDEVVQEVKDITAKFDAYKAEVDKRDAEDKKAIDDLKVALAEAVANEQDVDLSSVIAVLDSLKAEIPDTAPAPGPDDSLPSSTSDPAAL